jgi:GDP-L-fucose synthase
VKILVTGAGGMVGRNLLADPRAAEHDILRPSRGELDLLNGAACQAFIDRTAPDVIVHLAARVGGIAANIAAPVDFLADNLAIGLNVLAAARRAETPAFVNLGSSCMYPTGQPQPLTEDRLLTGPLEPTNEGYALAKLAIWKLATAIGEEDPRRAYRTLIPPNLYGSFDSFDPVRSHLVAAAIRKVDAAVRRGEATVEIWGDGLARREFMFAADLADFIWRHIGRLAALPPCMNVGVGADHSVNDYYRAVAEVLGFKGRFVHDRTKPVGVRRKLLDVTAQTALGWRPATALIDGIAAAADDYRSRGC